MGRIRPGYVKNAAKVLLQNYPDEFTTDFETNKRLVQQYTDVTSKAVRNRLAGYLVQLIKIAKVREAYAASGAEEPMDMEM
ncbi:MAG: 30S ribosomal protein S17e [Candidatus Thorarchaeota archaeon]|nr:30S ribosomal protein S17e [Candidatus Thorarchaeota archaeon]